MKVKVKKLKAEATLPKYAHDTDAGMDICSVESVSLESGIPTLVRTGLAVEIPKGYEVQVRPRSGLALKGVTVWNSPGTIDADYRGEIGVILFYMNNSSAPVFQIKAGDRIAQLVFSPVTHGEVEEVKELTDTERGTGGFGSTGTAAL